jgi:hypothetical protein
MAAFQDLPVALTTGGSGLSSLQAGETRATLRLAGRLLPREADPS